MIMLDIFFKKLYLNEKEIYLCNLSIFGIIY